MISAPRPRKTFLNKICGSIWIGYADGEWFWQYLHVNFPMTNRFYYDEGPTWVIGRQLYDDDKIYEDFITRDESSTTRMQKIYEDLFEYAVWCYDMMMQGDPGMDSITARLRRRQPGRISMNFRNFIERFYLVLQVLRRGVEDSRRPGPFGLQI